MDSCLAVLLFRDPPESYTSFLSFRSSISTDIPVVLLDASTSSKVLCGDPLVRQSESSLLGSISDNLLFSIRFSFAAIFSIRNAPVTTFFSYS